MSATATPVRGYNATGETVEITQELTERQYRQIQRLVGEPPGGRFKEWCELFFFDPPTPKHGRDLRAYLRKEGIVHGYEQRYTWATRAAGDTP